ncbi:MAG: SDR family oxidoreductase [Haliea sp.]|nr:SDR family oxidoreductase [Haliea sp.]
MSYLKDKVVVITGAASGFGRLVACKAAARGACVIGGDVTEEELANTVDMATSAGGSMVGLRADVRDPADMTAMVLAALEHFGKVDVLINNAGVMPLAFFADHNEAAAAWNHCIDINFKGVLNGICAVHDQMIAQGAGHIVNLSSIYGNYPVRGAAVYGATKAAVSFMSEALRQESQGRIKVTTIRPTGIPTTGISNGVVNFEAGAGIVGVNNEIFFERFSAIMEGEAPQAWTDANSIEYFALAAEELAEQILYVIDQPWGVSISDITVRASGDLYVI